MREIKFRAWIDYGEGSAEMLSNVQNHINGGWAFGHLLNAGNVKVMQYTGLKDKNGVECYEGDIIKIQYTSCTGNISYYPLKVVTYSVDACRFGVNCDMDFEVIGNIHQHKYLIDSN